MKKKSKEDPSNMSPKEFARYAMVSVVNSLHASLDDDSKAANDDFLNSKSFVQEHIQKMDKDEYIEYLEQLSKEIELKQTKLYYGVLEVSGGAMLRYLETYSQDIKSNSNEDVIKRSKETLAYVKKEKAALDYEFAHSRYAKEATLTDMLIKST